MQKGKVEHILSKLQGKRVLVFGDLMLDRYIHVSVSRMSQEAPVPVWEWQAEEVFAGGAASAAACLSGLGADVFVAGIVGEDAAAGTLLDLLFGLGVESGGVSSVLERPTTEKIRLVADGRIVGRMDRECAAVVPGAKEAVFGMLQNAGDFDAILVSDYGKGLVCRSSMEVIHQNYDVPLYVSPKNPDWRVYGGAMALLPNEDEATAAAVDAGYIADISSMAEYLRTWRDADVCVTRGKCGVCLAERKAGAVHILAYPVLVSDTVGAGEAFSAGYVAAQLAGEDPVDSARFGCLVASISVQSFGPAPVTREQVLEAVEETETETVEV